MPEPDDIERDLQRLEADLKRLEAEYNMYFAGRLPRPPWETRGRVTAAVKRLDALHISNYGTRFRFSTLQSRFATFVDLWDRGLRAREEGRAGPFAQTARPRKPPDEVPATRVVHVAAFSDPKQEMDKLLALYDRLVETRREAGLDSVPFHKFAAVVGDQVRALKEKGSPEVAFRVAVKGGKVSFTARALKGAGKVGSGERGARSEEPEV